MVGEPDDGDSGDGVDLPDRCVRGVERAGLVPVLYADLLKYFGAMFVGQDQETMVEQAQGLRYGPALMLIDDADKPAKWYFALKQARLRGTGEHPMVGPVTLHWRS